MGGGGHGGPEAVALSYLSQGCRDSGATSVVVATGDFTREERTAFAPPIQLLRHRAPASFINCRPRGQLRAGAPSPAV